MPMPMSIRLDAAVRAELERAAEETGKSLSVLVRDALTDLAREMRRQRIKKASAAVAAHVAADPEARAFFADWGTPTTDV
jgi:predicted transcriptional regulator